MHKVAFIVQYEFLPTRKVQEACEALIKEFGIRHEKLLQSQIAEALHQAILAGDFVRFVITHPDQAGAVIYTPFMGVEDLRSENRRLKERIAQLESESLEKAVSGERSDD